MTKHIADKLQESGPGRLRNFTRQEREAGLHPSIAILHERPRNAAEAKGRRLAEFTRIDRGHRV
ncbi:hypothetical protein [Paracoccus litorisediminis]|uniref:Uncharacterized protein n=1 Tax=Paracoccus litorisediminis TaxID=2006130 RepID=A0A844HUE1_9RHOB|nr:hypothetical protein [Paracoccus litorisediminis]MTH61957.1 hypothetical protein [Paracoccus litorisediminis]